jgi:hypothetical protein
VTMDSLALVEAILDLEYDFRITTPLGEALSYQRLGELHEELCQARRDLSPDDVWQRLTNHLRSVGAPRDRLRPETTFEALLG